jgi:hypothetical protein
VFAVGNFRPEGIEMTRRHSDPVLLAIIFVSLGTNALLLYRIRNNVDPGHARVSSRDRSGTQFERVEITDGGGGSLELTGGSKPTVVYVFSPNCGWCSRNHASIVLLAEAAHKDYTFVGLAVSDAGLQEYLARFPLEFPVHVVSRNAVMSLRLDSTPETILVGADGGVRKDWHGAYFGRVGADVGSYFKADLPTAVADLGPK